MTVKYIIVGRQRPGDPGAPTKYYPLVKSRGRTTLRQLATHIATISTVSTVDTMAVLEAFLQVVPQELADGNTVHLGDFGSFSLRTKAEGADTPEEVRASNIKKVQTTFRPGKLFKDVLNAITFEREAS